MKISELKNRIGHITQTCSTQYPRDNSVCFVRDIKYFPLLEYNCLYILVSHELYNKIMNEPGNEAYRKSNLIPCQNPERTFILFHNQIYHGKQHRPHDISSRSTIHKLAIIGASGMKYIRSTEGGYIKMFHAGNIIIEGGVTVGAGSVIQRGTINSTIIRRGAKIDCNVCIGHNSDIGENTLIITGVNIAGSVTIGKNCFISVGAIIINGVTICNDVMVGAGSVVIKNIKKPGCYWGNPARRIGDWAGEF